MGTVFKLQEEIHDLLFQITESALGELGLLDTEMERYLGELKTYSLCRKTALLDTSYSKEVLFHYDFQAMEAKRFVVYPNDYVFEHPTSYVFKHVAGQVNQISSYITQYGTSLDGLGRILMRAQYHSLVRKADPVDLNSSVQESCEVV